MLNNRVILITGGTGSFGRKCVDAILARYRPRKIIVFSRDEFKQFEMARQFPAEKWPIRYFIGDVRDKDRLKWAFQDVDYIVHAAAMKQVPASEYNPTECIRTNIAGSENVVNVAADCGVRKVIALSTDKAVNPVNLYGATKLCAEKLFIAANAFVGQKKCSYAVVRYGNVIGSRGSVIPLFLKKRPGVLPVTDPGMTRFWLSLDQGVEFVLECLDRMTGGETFVPRIPSLNIMDLARYMAPECTTEVIGIRQGEKLHETLISRDEARNTLACDTHYVIQPDNMFFTCRMDTKGFVPVAQDFEYRSDTNPDWVTRGDVEGMIEALAGDEND